MNENTVSIVESIIYIETFVQKLGLFLQEP